MSVLPPLPVPATDPSPRAAGPLYAQEVDDILTVVQKVTHVSVAPTTHNVEAYGVLVANDAATNTTKLQALYDLVKAAGGGRIVYPNIYNVNGPLSLSGAVNIEHVGVGTSANVGDGLTGLIMANNPGDRAMDLRDAARQTFRHLKFSFPIDGSYWGFDFSLISTQPKGLTFEHCGIGGANPTRALKAINLAGARDVIIKRTHLTRYTIGVDGCGGVGGGSSNVTIGDRCVFDSGSATQVPIMSPTAAWSVRDSVFEPGSSGTPSLIRRNVTTAPDGFILEGNWIGDSSTADTNAFIECYGHGMKIGPNFISVPGGGSASRLVTVKADSIYGLEVHGRVQGAGIGVDYGTTDPTSHRAHIMAFTMPASGAQPIIGNIPHCLVGVASYVGTPISGLAVGAQFRLGKTLHSVGTVDPNGNVVGSPGDEYTNTSGAASHVKWVKQTGSATNTGWVNIV